MTFDSRISTIVESQLPRFVLEEGENFVAFLKAYYEWMEGSCLTYTSASGSFSNGEIIVGATSKARATIKAINTIGKVLDVDRSTQKDFQKGETITGLTSGVTAVVSKFVDMPIRASQSLQDYRDISLTMDGFIEHFRREYLQGIPMSVLADKRLLVKHIREFYRAKGTEKAIKFLFRILYNEDVEFYYPNVDVLRVSDGKWLNSPVLRLASTSTVTQINGYKITGLTSGATATVESLVQYYLGSYYVTEVELSSKVGDFEAGETVRASVNGVNIDTTVYGVLASTQIVTRGTGYQAGDALTITGGGGIEASASVLEIYTSNVQNITVTTPGVGYRINDPVTFTGGDGSGANAIVQSITNAYSVTVGANSYTVGNIHKIRVVSTGAGYTQAPNVSHSDSIIFGLGLLSDQLLSVDGAGTNYKVGDTVNFPSAFGSGAAARISQVTETANTSFNFQLEDGSGNIRIEDNFGLDRFKLEDWTGLGPISKVEFSSYGSGYTMSSPPILSVTSNTGSGASLSVTGIQGSGAVLSLVPSGMGAIRAVRITQAGVGYTSAPTIDLSGKGDGNASVTATLGTNARTNPGWLNTDGHLSSDKYIQDSRYYQIYSYVIKSTVSIDTYRNIVKEFVHPAGFALFGQFSVLMYASPFGYNLNANSIAHVSIEIPLTANVIPSFVSGSVIGIPQTIFTIEPFGSIRTVAFNQSNSSVVQSISGDPGSLNYDPSNRRFNLTARAPSHEIAFTKYVGNTATLAAYSLVPLNARDYAFTAVESGLSSNNYIMRHANKNTTLREALTVRPDYLYSTFQIGYWTPSLGPQAKSNTEVQLSTYANTQIQDFSGFYLPA